jgi:uncharacterized membrane protein
LQKQEQIEIEDAIIAVKDENGAVELKQLPHASSFCGITAASGVFHSDGRRRFDLLRRNEKFVRELTEAIPLNRGAVFVLLGKMPAATKYCFF